MAVGSAADSTVVVEDSTAADNSGQELDWSRAPFRIAEWGFCLRSWSRSRAKTDLNQDSRRMACTVR